MFCCLCSRRARVQTRIISSISAEKRKKSQGIVPLRKVHVYSVANLEG